MAKKRFNKRHLLMLRWGIPCGAAALIVSFIFVLGAVRDDPAAPNADGSIAGLTSILSRELAPDENPLSFEDVSIRSGIRFRHFPAERRSLLPEDMGSGLAWGDYDDDGDPDLFIVNWKSSILEPFNPDRDAGRCALYRNDGGFFVDVTDECGVGATVFGMAAAWADFDNDNDLDLYVTCYGCNILYRNNGNGSFSNITHEAGVGDDSFGAGCSWADYDRDGLIDLYVCNYVEFEYRADDRRRTTRQYGSEIPFTINPSAYAPKPNRLYRNNGDGTFTDVASAAGVANPTGRSLGAAWFDFDNDGWSDLYVANDISANGVFRNMGDGTFADIGASSLAADYRGAMGLAVGDYEHDGDPDLFVTHWIAQENAFFENMASENFTDESGELRLFFMDNADLVGLGQLSLKTVGWSTGLTDFDNDGLLDLWVVNGNTLEDPEDHTQLRPQLTHLFWRRPVKSDDDREGYYEVGADACERFAQPFVGRGGAAADFDGDGRVDLALMRHGEELILLRNTTDTPNHWLGVRLRQTGRNTRALGARVEIRAGDMRQAAQVGVDGGYLSQHELDLHFGLGAITPMIDQLRIEWPDGEVTTYRDLQVDRVHTFTHTPDYSSTGNAKNR